MPTVTFHTLIKNLGIPRELITVVTSTDNPQMDQITKLVESKGLRLLAFDREDHLHDPYLSLMDESAVREYYPTTDTPARRFISEYEYGLDGDRVYAVLDDDIRFHTSNPFRLKEDSFQHSVWDEARSALQNPSVWACSFVNQYTWRGSYKRTGVPARLEYGSKWHRTGMLSAQSIWIFSNQELHTWYSPIITDYVSTSRYAAQGRYLYILDEYAHVEPPNQEGGIWSSEDPLSRDTLAYYVAQMRTLGVSDSDSGKKPFKKFQKYMYPVIHKDTDQDGKWSGND